MIFFSGFGFLVPVIGAIGFILPIVFEQWIKRQFGFHTPNSVVMTLAALLPFLGMLGLDGLLKRRGPTRTAVDVNTGQLVEIATTHTFMFLPVKWCAFIWIGLAICTTIATLLN